MLIRMWGASLSGDPPQGTAQQFQKNRDLYFKKKLNKSPALLIGECYPHPHPDPPTHCFPGLHPHPATAPGVFTTWNNRGLGWGALQQGGGGTGQVPPKRGPPRQHNINKKSCKSGRNGDIIPRSLYTDTASPAGKWGARWDRQGYVVGKWASPGLVREDKASTPLPPASHPTFGNESPSGSPWW